MLYVFDPENPIPTIAELATRINNEVGRERAQPCRPAPKAQRSAWLKRPTARQRKQLGL